MTVGFASSVVNGWLDGTYSTTNMWVKLHTGDPGAAGTSNAAAGDTNRRQVTMASASGGSKALSSSPTYTNGGTSETITHVSFWSLVSAGVYQGSGALGTSKAWASGDTLDFTTLTIAITPIAA